MPNNSSSFQQLRVSDPVITQVVQGYRNVEGVAGFIAPTVYVPTRGGKTVLFTKENFAVLDLNRAPGTRVKRVGASFDTRNYFISQMAIGAEVPREIYEEALNGAARIDLRTQAALRAAELLQQSWESETVTKVYNTANFETGNVVNAGGPVTDFDNLIADAQEIIRAQIGRYANSAVVSSDVYRFIKRNSIYRDRIKYTSSASIAQDMISSWWDLPRGVKISLRQKLNADGTLSDMVPAGTILLFYNPEGSNNDGFLPSEGANYGEPAFAYTYMLNGYPIAEAERFDPETKSYITDLIAEQEVNITGMGATGKAGAAVLIQGITG